MRKFNITAACNPNIHYMVDLSSRLSDIKDMIDDGQCQTVWKNYNAECVGKISK